MLVELAAGILGLILLGWGVSGGFAVPPDRRAKIFSGRFGWLLNIVVLAAAALILHWAFFSSAE